MLNWLIVHQTAAVLVAYWLFSSIVSALPSPMSQTSFYRFFFNLMHGLAGSIGRISPVLRIPGPNTADLPATVTLDLPKDSAATTKEAPKP